MFEKLMSFENLSIACKKAMNGCRKTRSVCEFDFNREKELLAIQDELGSGTYRPGGFHYFTIYDPKKRTIAVAPFRDRVVHHALVNVLESVFEKRFIYHSYASRKNKGAHKALMYAQKFTRKRRWYVKVDVEQFFASIDHEILMTMIEKKVSDHKVTSLAGRIVRHAGQITKGKGLPIGNLTSQFFANVYLDVFDHFIKDELGIKGYLRYMDDFIIFGWSKKQVTKRFETAKKFLDARLNLKINPKSSRQGKSRFGVSFLGMIIFPGMIRVRAENKKRSFLRIKNRLRQWSRGDLTDESLVASLGSIYVHLNYFANISGFDGFGSLNPQKGGSNRVNRGGSWNNKPANVRCANRNRNTPSNTNNNLGFRLINTGNSCISAHQGGVDRLYPVQVQVSMQPGRSGC